MVVVVPCPFGLVARSTKLHQSHSSVFFFFSLFRRRRHLICFYLKKKIRVQRRFFFFTWAWNSSYSLSTKLQIYSFIKSVYAY